MISMTHTQLQTQTQKVVLSKQQNVLGVNHLKQINNLVDGSNFSWFYYSDVHRINPEHRQEWNLARHCFVHQCWFDNQQLSQYFPIFEPIFYKMADAINVEYIKPLKMQVNMMLNVGKTVDGNEHIDGFLDQEQNDLEWFTGIYYINDSDGDTTIFLPNGEKEIVSPISDSLVVFNGELVHSAQLPLKHNRRIAVNVNFLGRKL